MYIYINIYRVGRKRYHGLRGELMDNLRLPLVVTLNSSQNKKRRRRRRIEATRGGDRFFYDSIVFRLHDDDDYYDGQPPLRWSPIRGQLSSRIREDEKIKGGIWCILFSLFRDIRFEIQVNQIFYHSFFFKLTRFRGLLPRCNNLFS